MVIAVNQSSVVVVDVAIRLQILVGWTNPNQAIEKWSMIPRITPAIPIINTDTISCFCLEEFAKKVLVKDTQGKSNNPVAVVTPRPMLRKYRKLSVLNWSTNAKGTANIEITENRR